MATFLKLARAVSFFLVLASATPTMPFVAVRQESANSTGFLIPPSQDPFYSEPVGYESARPGTILRHRVAPGNLTIAVGNCSAAYQFVYRTTDSRYKPTWAVTTLYVPDSTKGDELLSFQYPYNSPNIDYSPSYAFQFAPAFEVGIALGNGWYVNVPDHEGILAADGANVGQGHATLDSVRATLSAGYGLHSGTKYAMMGYSGGALATEWAAELQVQYAPELNFSGAALGGTPPNVTNVWDTTNGGPFAGMVALSSVGVTKPYPGMFDWLVAQLNAEGPYNRTTFLQVENMGAEEGFAFFANHNMWNYFVDGRAFIDDPRMQRILDDNFYMGYHGVPHMPLYMHHAIHDEVTPISNTDNYVQRLCGVHTNILYERNTVGDHISEMVNGAPASFEWLSAIFAGAQTGAGCITRNVTVGVESLTLK